MLNKSKVEFDEEYHRYFLDRQELKGITGVISRYLFPHKYCNVPERILERAKDKGHEIHKACELYNIFPTVYDDRLPELRQYVALLNENKIVPLEAEYLVSNKETHATKIDMIDEQINLYDIKTTSTLDKNYLSWQLSICAYLFELENPGVVVGKLYGVWLRETAKLVEVQRIDSEIVKSLLEADAMNAEWINPIQTEEIVFENGEKLHLLESAIVELKQQIEEYEAAKKLFVDELEQKMIAANERKWEEEGIRVTRVAPTVSTTFNSKLFSEQHPELYYQYTITNPKKGYIKIKLL